MTVNNALWILYGALAIIAILLIAIIVTKVIHLIHQRQQGEARDYLFKRYFDHEDVKRSFNQRFFFDAYIDIETQVQIEDEIRELVIYDLMQTHFVKKQFHRLKSLSTVKRRLAIFYLSHLHNEKSIKALKNRLAKEKNPTVRFHIITALIEFCDQEVCDIVMESLIGSPKNYQRWVRALIVNHYQKVSPFFKYYFLDSRREIAAVVLELAQTHLEPQFKDYCLRIFREALLPADMQKTAISALTKTNPQELMKPLFFKHEEAWVRQMAIEATVGLGSEIMVSKLLSMLGDEKTDDYVINALSRIVFDSKQLLLYLLNQFPLSTRDVEKVAIARVMAHRIDYILLKLKDKEHPYVTSILDIILSLHIVEDFIDFLNTNRDPELTRICLPIIKKHVAKDLYLMEQIQIYLSVDLLKQMGLMSKPQPIIPREQTPFEKDKVIWISLWISFAILILPLLYFIIRFRLIFFGDIKVFEYMIININTYLVAYFMFVNGVYLLLLTLSLFGAKEQRDLWHIKRETLLFEHRLLPTISIIAPAYNEEKSIIESVTSLLNIKYPGYEIIVVNDGSKDKTLQVLIDHFELERKHPFFKRPINTRPLRGVYINQKIPNLVVIDKVNGGKADALNLGINVAKYDYVCGIDADSILDEDALLRLVSVTLDDTTDHIALGGNIVPVNGCVVEQGNIEKTGLGKKPLVRFQTIEYLRAFTTGRIGWSKLRSLMIISGAFGLFQRRMLIRTGGYLTISGDLKKDTVGEDMELVVRLTFQALRDKFPYRVKYVHHANCYTELPSDMKSLLKQRNRWQRGLLDILSYHRRLLFNPKFKQVGMIAFPYFFIFEMIGPFIEMIGYIALIIGLIMGILNGPLVIVLFVATILFGMIISLFSLYITERVTPFYSIKETFLLMWVAIIENLGYRQLTSLHRVVSTFSALREKGSWGSQMRTGFQKKA